MVLSCMFQMGSRNPRASKYHGSESGLVSPMMFNARLKLEVAKHSGNQWGCKDRQMLLDNGIPGRGWKWTES